MYICTYILYASCYAFFTCSINLYTTDASFIQIIDSLHRANWKMVTNNLTSVIGQALIEVFLVLGIVTACNEYDNMVNCDSPIDPGL